MKTKQKILSLLLCIAMLFSLSPTSAFAETAAGFSIGAGGLCEHHPKHDDACGYTEDTPCGFVCEICSPQDDGEINANPPDTQMLNALPAGKVASGDFGTDFHWELDDNDTLTIRGTGAMPDGESISNFPWEKYSNKIKKVVVEDNVTSIGNNAFYSCTNLEQVELSDSVTSIGNQAFFWCEKLAQVKLPDGVTSIGNSAFNNCKNLALTKLPDGLISIGNSAFNNCTNIALTELPTALTTIGNSAFEGCTNLVLTKLPDRVTSIGESAFYNCKNIALKELPSGVDTIKKSAFEGCTNLVLTELSDNVTSIGERAFFNCENIALTELPESVKSIGKSAFYNCENIKLTELPEGVISIGGSAFSGCRGLKELTIANAEKLTVDSYAFNGCHGLTKVTFNNNNELTLGDYAFKRCGGLTEVIFTGSEAPTLGSDVFLECDNLIAIYVPEGAVQSYLNNGFPANKVAPNVEYNITVTVENPEGGTASPSTAQSKARQQITLTAAPNSGYHFTKWEVTPEELQINDDNSFTMPIGDASIKAVFEKHTLTRHDAVAATCTADGSIEYWFCDWCNKNFSDPEGTSELPEGAEITEKLGHDYLIESTTAPTCTEQGYTLYKCSHCDETEKRDLIPATGHKPSAPATCTADQTCTVCGEVLAAKLGHTGGAATCSAKAICTRCNQEYGEVDPAKHLNTELRNEKAPTATENGYTGDLYCTDCGSLLQKGTAILMTKYTVTIKGSYATASGAGNYAAGETVAIDAGSRSSYYFNGWTSADGITFADGTKAATTFVMLDKPVTVTAAWTYLGESSGDGSYDGGYDYSGAADDDKTTDADTSSKNDDKTTDKAGKDDDKATDKTGKDNSETAAADNTSEGSSENPFTDIKENDWFYQDIMFVYEKGLLTGTDPAAFAPNASATRAQLAAIFYRMAGSPKTEGRNSFIDLAHGANTAWYYDAVTWAEQNGIMSGYDNGAFAPDDPITREQLAAIFCRYARYKGDATAAAGNLDRFIDGTEISPWARENLSWAVGVGLLNGTAENQLSPQGTATRAQIAAMLQRFVKQFA